MDITVRVTEPLLVEDRSWLGSRTDTEATRSITLATATFVKNTHYPNGVLKSGTFLARITSAGATQNMYGPADAAATDGRQLTTRVGFLFNSLAMTLGGPNLGAPLLERGFIVPAKLPANHGWTSGLQTATAGRFVVRD